MRLMIRRLVAAAGLLALGWTAGQAAQAPQADFEITITSNSPPSVLAPVSGLRETTVTCTRGCSLQFIRNTPDKSKAAPSFTYGCSGDAINCRGSVHGWVIR